MKKWIVLVALFFIGLGVKAQYGTYNGPDRYFYDEEFDWRWDIRVRISDGFNSGFLTRRESNRLYRRLEDIERREWAFQADGHYSVWEQDEIWYDVVDLNQRIGLELTDWDRRYYGYNGVVLTGRMPWYFGSAYDFYRFDRRGYGTINVGYAPRNYYPVKHIYYTKQNNYTTHWQNSPTRVTANNRSTAGSRVQSSRVSAPTRNESSRVSSPNGVRNESSRVSESRGYEPVGTSRGLENNRSSSETRNTYENANSGRVSSGSRTSSSGGNPESSRGGSVQRSSPASSESGRSSAESRVSQRSSSESSGRVSSGSNRPSSSRESSSSSSRSSRTEGGSSRPGRGNN